MTVHFTPRCVRLALLGLGPALDGVEAAAGLGFQRGEERVRADRPADAFAFAGARRRRFGTW